MIQLRDICALSPMIKLFKLRFTFETLTHHGSDSHAGRHGSESTDATPCVKMATKQTLNVFHAAFGAVITKNDKFASKPNYRFRHSSFDSKALENLMLAPD